MNIQRFINRHGIQIESRMVGTNPNREDFEGDHWRVTLRCGRRQMTIPFSKGYGYGGREPQAAEVLECMVSDASEADLSFEEWASDLGYSTDSRKAERTYRAVQAQTAKLRKFLGSHDYAVLLDASDREEPGDESDMAPRAPVPYRSAECVQEKYNGWTNYDTWNVALWVGNEEPWYRAMMAAGGRNQDFTAQSAEEFARDLWPSGKTPDDADLDAVNWREIADSWNEA